MLNAFFLNTKFLIASFAKLKLRTVAFSIFVPSAYFGTAAMIDREVDDELRQIGSEVNTKLSSEISKDMTPLVDLYLGLGQHNLKNGNATRALEYYRKAEAVVQSGKVIKTDMTEDVYLGMSNSLQALGDDHNAAEYLEKSVDYRVNDTKSLPSFDLNNYRSAAMAYEKSGDLVGAYRCYHKIATLGEAILGVTSPIYLEAKADLDRLQRDLEKAI